MKTKSSSNSEKGVKSVKTIKKPRLGRGLSSLILNSDNLKTDLGTYQGLGDNPQPSQPEEKIARPAEISIGSIAPNPYQPRREFKNQDLEDLANSISQQGILQPLIIARSEGAAKGDAPFVLIAGERRLRAAKQAGLKNVPCIIRHASPQQMLEWAIVENIQRADLNPLERAHAYRDYMDRFSLTQAQAGEKLGQSRAAVANHLRMLELPDSVQKMLLDGSITFGHAKVLASLAGQDRRQMSLAKKIVVKSLSVRQLEDIVAACDPQKALAEKQKSSKASNPPYIVDLERQLTETVGTRVFIKPTGTKKAKNKGKIVIEYYTLDDFDRITEALGAKIQG